jgi:hypothetical protein
MEKRGEYLEISFKEFRELTKDNKELRNAFSTAHGVIYKEYPKFQGTCSYPTRYIATKHMIESATQSRKKAMKNTLEDNKNNLLFVGMGMEITKDRQKEMQTDLINFRFRTNLQNPDGCQFFVEFSSYNHILNKKQGSYLGCDFAFDYDEKGRQERLYKFGGNYYNYKNMEKEINTKKMRFTKENVLKMVNKFFNCNFKDLIIDNYDIYGLDNQIIAISPDLPNKEIEAAKKEATKQAGNRENHILNNLEKAYFTQKDENAKVIRFTATDGKSFEFETIRNAITN